ncbi:MAG: Gfo/Idh/MocA family oxidoreductase [Verrucomicrobiae bacterium]
MNNPIPQPEKACLERFQTGVYDMGGGRKLPYRLFAPANLAPGAKCPLVVFFHGAGERGCDNAHQLDLQTAPMVFAGNEVQSGHPCYVLAPQCPADQQWVDMPWGDTSGKQPESPTWPMAAAWELVKNLVKTHAAIDGSHVVATGFSMGAFGVFDAMIRWPEMFARGMAVCGGGDESTVAPLAGKPLWVFHSEDDQVVPVARSRNMVAAIRAAGGTPSYTEYPASMGLLHLSWNEAFLKTPEIFEGLLGPAKAAAPNLTVREEKRLRIGIIGTGVIVRDYHLVAIKDYPERFQVTALCNRSRERAEEMSSSLGGGLPVCTDHRELLASPDVDVVLIAVPPFAIEEIACDALRSGKHVLLEKPMGNTADDAARVLEASRKATGKFMVAENALFHPVTQKLIQMARNKEWPYGKPNFIELHQFWKMTPRSIPQFYNSTWRHDERLTHGYLIEGGCHTVNPIREMFGMPTKIRSRLLSADPALGKFDTCLAHCEFADGTLGQITMSYGIKSPDSHLFKLYAKDGTLFTEMGSLGTIDEDGINLQSIPKLHPGGFHAEWIHFHDVICHGAKPQFTAQQSFDDILFMQMLIDAAER